MIFERTPWLIPRPNYFLPEESNTMQITNETKAVLNAEQGRVIGFVKSNEPRKISLAIPNDRAVMTPIQARQLASWLTEEANRAGAEPENMADRVNRQFNEAEEKQRAEIRASLGDSPTGRRPGVAYRRAY